MKPQIITPKAIMLFTYLLVNLKLSAVEFINQGFDSGTVAPVGWIIKASGLYTSASGSGEVIPSLKLSNMGDFIETPEFSGATECSFMIKGYSNDSLTALNVFAFIASKWQRIDSINNISKSKKIIVMPISALAKKLRFVLYKSKGNIAFDDLIIKNNAIAKDTIPPLFKKEPQYSIDSETSVVFTVSIDKPGDLYYIITSENCTSPTPEQMQNNSDYDSTCFIKGGYYAIHLNIDTSIKIDGLNSGSKYIAYWLIKNDAGIAKNNAVLPVNFSFPKSNYDLFFSEIIKGSGNNKAIEIFNPSADTAYLKNYRIAMSSNGGGWKTSYYKFPSGSKIAPNDVFVILKANADTNLVDFKIADDSTNSAVLGYTGNDARGLQITTNNGMSWTFIDIFGYQDSSMVFDIAGIEEAASNHTLVRKKHIKHGNTNWTLSAGTNDKNSEWIVKDQNDYSNLGTHQMSNDTALFFENIAFENQELLPVIDSIDHIISFILHSESDLKEQTLLFSLQDEIMISPAPSTVKDFSEPVKFVLSNTGQTITTEWTVKASVDQAPKISSASLVDANSGKIKIVFSETINLQDIQPFIRLFETNSNINIQLKYEFEQENKVLNIETQSKLKGGASYTLIVDSIKDKFLNVMSSFEWTFVTKLSAVNAKSSEIQIYPNPAKDVVYINIDKNIFPDHITITIIGTDGKQYFSNNFYNNEDIRLNIANLVSGIYVIYINDKTDASKHYLLKKK